MVFRWVRSCGTLRTTTYYVQLSRKGEILGCSIIGYMDNTLVLCAGNTVEAVQSNINAYIRLTLKRTGFLSLEVAPDKTEVVLFKGRRRLGHATPIVRICDTAVGIKSSIKYLRVILDSRKKKFQRTFYIIYQ